MTMNGTIIPPMIIDGKEYMFDGNVKNNGKRIRLYLRNKIGIHFVIMNWARNISGEIVSGYVAVYILKEEKLTDEYLQWWNTTIKDAE